MDLQALATKAQAILQKHGGLMTLVALPAAVGTFDPVADTLTTATPAEYPVYGVLPPPGSGLRFENGTLVQRSGERAKIEAKGLPTGVIPQPGWLLRTARQTFKILNVRTTSPDDITAVIFDLELGR